MWLPSCSRAHPWLAWLARFKCPALVQPIVEPVTTYPCKRSVTSGAQGNQGALQHGHSACARSQTAYNAQLAGQESVHQEPIHLTRHQHGTLPHDQLGVMLWTGERACPSDPGRLGHLATCLQPVSALLTPGAALHTVPTLPTQLPTSTPTTNNRQPIPPPHIDVPHARAAPASAKGPPPPKPPPPLTPAAAAGPACTPLALKSSRASKKRTSSWACR